eukprot:8206869-Pyramimonas_sp.AAC.1
MGIGRWSSSAHRPFHQAARGAASPSHFAHSRNLFLRGSMNPKYGSRRHGSSGRTSAPEGADPGSLRRNVCPPRDMSTQ